MHFLSFFRRRPTSSRDLDLTPFRSLVDPTAAQSTISSSKAKQLTTGTSIDEQCGGRQSCMETELRLLQSSTNSVTGQCYHDLVDTTNVPLTRSEFVMLCAYISVVISWGYRGVGLNVDYFVLSYPLYREKLGDLYQEQINTPIVSVPSYHVWLEARAEDEGSLREDGQVITLHKLGLMEDEHPYSFLSTRKRMAMMAEARLKQTG